MEKKYLLVCEGPTDFFVIEKISERLEEITGKKITIRPLSPRPNPATNEWPPQGWTAVKDWCRIYKSKNEADLDEIKIPAVREFARRQNWRALIQADNADGIILQIDTDIAECIKEPNEFNAATTHRREHLKGAIEFWLGENVTSDQIYLAITSHALEAWILATHDRTDPVFSDLHPNFNYEDITDPEERMIVLGYESTQKDGRNRIKKCERTYKTYGTKISQNLESVREKCMAANELCTHIES